MRFSNVDLMEFFEKQGLHLKVERGSRVFPVDDKAASVLNVLKKALYNREVSIIYNASVLKINIRDDLKEIILSHRNFPAKRDNLLKFRFRLWRDQLGKRFRCDPAEGGPKGDCARA